MIRWLLTMCLSFGLLLSPSWAVCSAANRCAKCHPQEVKGYSHSAMSRSLRRPGKEPEGTFVHSLSGTKFTIYSNRKGLWRRMEQDGHVSEYQVAYVVGSGNHASGYLVRIGDHLFQSPLCYCTRLSRYDMAPGYEENRTPDFIRAVSEACLLCHSGKPLPIAGTLNEFIPLSSPRNRSFASAVMAIPNDILRRRCPARSLILRNFPSRHATVSASSAT